MKWNVNTVIYYCIHDGTLSNRPTVQVNIVKKSLKSYDIGKACDGEPNCTNIFDAATVLFILCIVHVHCQNGVILEI